MKKPMLLTLLTAIALITLLGTSWADTPPSDSSPEVEVRFPDSWESFPRHDDDVRARLRAARKLIFPFRSGPGTPMSISLRLQASLVGPCLAQAGGRQDLCEQAREISRLPACVRPEDCQAYDMTRQLLGEPEVRMAPANEQIMTPANE